MIELLPDGNHLTALEIGDPDGPPALGGADHGTEHELEDGLFAERIGNDLEAPALLDEQTLQKVRCPDGSAVGDRHAQVRDGRLEVIHEAGHGTRQLAVIVADQPLGQVTGNGTRWRLVGSRSARLELGPQVFRHLDRQIAHAVRQAALAFRVSGSRSRLP